MKSRFPHMLLPPPFFFVAFLHLFLIGGLFGSNAGKAYVLRKKERKLMHF